MLGDSASFDRATSLARHIQGNPNLYRDSLGLVINIPDPNGVVPGGPWQSAGPGQPEGTYYGPKNPSGPRSMCRYVPDKNNGGPPGADNPYWKTQRPGQQCWDRFDLKGNPISAEDAHPGAGRRSQVTPIGGGPIVIFIWGMTWSPEAQ